MANKAVTLVWLGKDAKGSWKRWKAVTGGNGLPRPGYGIVGGQPAKVTDTANGRFQLRSYAGQKIIYTNIEGDRPSEALAALRRMESVLRGKAELEDTGVKVLEAEDRAKLTLELKKFLEATVAKGSEYAAGVYREAAEDFIEVTGRKYADEIARDDIAKFHATLRKRGLADRTVRNRHDRLMAFFRFLRLDIKTVAPSKPQYEEGLPEIYTDAQLALLFDGLRDDPYSGLAYDLLLKGGFREKEAVYLPWRYVNFERGTVRIRSNPDYGFKVKDKEQRDVPLPPTLMDKLSKWRELHPESALVLETPSGSPNRKLLRSLKGIAKRLDLACRECETCHRRNQCEQWFLHKFRATCITKWLRSGMDIRTVMKLSGHSDLESVMRYLTPASDESIRRHIDGMRWFEQEGRAS